MSKSWKLTPAIALMTAVALLIAGVAMAFYIELSYKEEKVSEVSVQAGILASTVTAALVFNDHDAAQEYVNALRANPDVQRAAVYDAKGVLFAGFSRVPAVSLPATAPEGPPRFAGERLIVTSPVTQGGVTLGTTYVETITEPFATRLARYGVIALLATMASLVVAVLGFTHAALARVNAELAHRAAALAAANRDLEIQIAQREKAEEALRQSQKMEAIGQLTGGVAHDFNNLLQVILGNLGAVQFRLDQGEAIDPDQLRRHVDAATRGGERAATLTQRLLAFSRRQPLAPKNVDVNKLVAGMSDLLHRALGESILIETVLAGGLWRISADANQIESALLNLAVNARDAMPDGGKLTIETANAHLDEAYALRHEEVRAGQYVVVAVSDAGSGMTKEVLSRAFDPFFTTKDIGKGTGLGLSQVYGFIKQSGGHTKIYSEPGDGTTVKLYLPRLPAVSGQDDEIKAPQDYPTGLQEEMILVVEDEPDVRSFTVEMLRELGYGIIEAVDGQEALRLLETTPQVKLLFTDVGLPGGLNGRQLAERARQMRPRLKILYTTGYARNAIVHDGRLDPGVELLSKPFSYSALATKLRAMLEQKT
jgi:signal transduction histidine kinase/ActR/RegA family two-component response regulator